MEIRYKDKKIRDICKNEKKVIKKYNKIIAEKLIFSIEFLKNSKSLKDVADYIICNRFRENNRIQTNYRTCYCQQRK